MGFETLHQLREIELDVSIEAPVSFYVHTDTPRGSGLIQRYGAVLLATSGRVAVNVRLPGDVTGKLLRLRLAPSGACVLYGARVFAKPLSSASSWGWFPLPVVPTPEGYATVALPIVPTPEGFAAARLPIEATPAGFATVKLPIVPTPDGWGEMKLPLRQTPVVPVWIDMPLDPIE